MLTISKSKKKIVALVLLSLLLVGLLIFMYLNRGENAPAAPAEIVYANREEQIKAESNTPEGKRIYINQLEGERNYSEAKKIAEELVAQTKMSTDAIALLNICSLYIEDGKEECINSTKEIVLKGVKDLDFFSAYGAAEVYEKNNDKTSAKKLYERALDVYPPESQTRELPIKTQDELKEHIKQLG